MTATKNKKREEKYKTKLANWGKGLLNLVSTENTQRKNREYPFTYQWSEDNRDQSLLLVSFYIIAIICFDPSCKILIAFILI